MKKFVYSLSVFTFLFSCTESGIDVKEEVKDEHSESVVNKIDDAMTTTIGGRMFSIPSPIQMSLLLKDEVDVYNEAMITNPENSTEMATTFKKAINMGVYGADLGYATIYEHNAQAVKYLKSVESLSDDLGIANAFNESLIQRFIDNGNDQDSMLVIMSEGYREGDRFLKDNEQHDVATLILTGGWIESLYFATVTYENSKSQEIANRIGEQKSALKTIIELLKEYQSDESYTDLITKLEDLKTDFDQVKFDYEYVEPVTNEVEGLTVIKSKTSVDLGNDTMKNISEKIAAIRNDLIK